MFTEIERNYQIADFVKKTNLDTKLSRAATD